MTKPKKGILERRIMGSLPPEGSELIRDGKLTTEGKQFRDYHEVRIRRGHNVIQAMYESYAALFSSGIYKATHKTFAGYLEATFGYSRTYTFYLCRAVEVVRNIQVYSETAPDGKRIPSSIPTHERQTRELAKLPPHEQAECWVEVTADTDTPKPEDLKAAVERRLRTDVPKDPEELEPPEEKDERLVNGAYGRKIVSTINDAMNLLRKVPDQPGCEMLAARARSIVRDLENAKSGVQVTVPYELCPKCNGETCPQCGNLGWVNSTLYRQLTD